MAIHTLMDVLCAPAPQGCDDETSSPESPPPAAKDASLLSVAVTPEHEPQFVTPAPASSKLKAMSGVLLPCPMTEAHRSAVYSARSMGARWKCMGGAAERAAVCAWGGTGMGEP